MMRICIILNPIAGAVRNVDAIRERLRRLKAERSCISEQSGDAEKFASEASDFDLIVSAGGDGTLNEVVNGIAQGGCNAALGVLPLGTGNDFARSLGVPNNLEAAIEQIMAGGRAPKSVGRGTTRRAPGFGDGCARGHTREAGGKPETLTQKTPGPGRCFRDTR